MTTAVKEKKPFLPQRKPAAAKGLALSTGTTTAVRSSVQSGSLKIGGEPRVHLLPADVIARKKLRVVKRRLWLAVIAVAAIAALAYGGAILSLTAAQAQLQSAQTATAQLVVQQAKYGEVSKVKGDIASIQGAQKSATASEILWAPYIAQLQASLPAGGSILSLNGGLAAAASAATAAPAVPLQSSHIASVNLTAEMAQGDIAGWLNSLPSIKGFAQVTPGSVTVDTKGGYDVGVTIYMDSKALSNRFAKAVK